MSNPETERKWMVPHRILHDVEVFALVCLVADWKVAVLLTIAFDQFISAPLGKYIDNVYTKSGK